MSEIFREGKDKEGWINLQLFPPPPQDLKANKGRIWLKTITVYLYILENSS